MAAFSYHSKHLTDWLKTSLEFWANNGRDDNHGWYEHLTRDKQADIGAIRRHRVQARQIYSYAIAQELNLFEGAQDLIQDTFDFMILQGWNGKHFIHRMDGDYLITDDRHDLYDHAFYLLAAGSAYSATGDKTYYLWIDKIISAIDDLTHKMGGWAEDNKATRPRRQNPHMHLFEAHLYLYETTGEKRFLKRANISLNLFNRHFYSAKDTAILEFFDEDWRANSDITEPGHAAEWIWLLGWYNRLTGTDHSDIRRNLYHSLALQGGPYLIDETSLPDHNSSRISRRLWVQTEWIKAHLTLIEDGYTPASQMLPKLLDHFNSEYLDTDGTWRDQFDRQSPKGARDIANTIPVSTHYHIVGMVKELKRVSELQNTKNAA